ncbi:hypothetical protein GN956_G12852 [Arapaima gigas]
MASFTNQKRSLRPCLGAGRPKPVSFSSSKVFSWPFHKKIIIFLQESGRRRKKDLLRQVPQVAVNLTLGSLLELPRRGAARSGEMLSASLE